MWADPNLKEFYGRVSRIEKAHAKGYGFEAKGTLGRSASWKRQQSGWRFVKPLALALLMGLGLKGVIHYYVGTDLYQSRVDELMAGEGFDRVGGTLMQADAVTLGISSAIAAIFAK